jgi:hypothetical protein
MTETREVNLQLLGDAGFRVADNLPILRTEGGVKPVLRPKDEILGRLLALKALWLWVDTHPDRESEVVVNDMVEANEARRHLTAEEVDILDLSREEAVAQHGHLMGWKNETCWSLGWVLGFPEVPSIQVGQVSGEMGRRLMLDWLPNNSKESRVFRASCELRDAQEVHKLEDLFYCAHNAVRSAQLGRDTVPIGFDPIVDGGCIHERRHALTWVLSPGVDWDDTDLST